MNRLKVGFSGACESSRQNFLFFHLFLFFSCRLHKVTIILTNILISKTGLETNFPDAKNP